MRWGRYESYEVVCEKELFDLNNLLKTCYNDNIALVNAQLQDKANIVERITFDNINASDRKHILIKEIGESFPCGTITIYRDAKRILPIESCLGITLDKVRAHNISFCECGRFAIMPSYRKDPENILLLFCEVIRFCIEANIHLVLAQVFDFNKGGYLRLGFEHFLDTHSGTYDSEFETNCYPMFAIVDKMYKTFADLVFNGSDIFIDASKFNFDANVIELVRGVNVKT